MTKEELLTRIRQLQNALPTAKTEEEQSNALEQLLAEENQYRTEISELEQKLANEENYKRHTALMDEARLDNLRSELDRISGERNSADVDSYNYQYRLQNIASELESARYLISEGEREISELQALSTSPRDRRYRDQIKATQDSIRYLNDVVSALTDEQETITTNLQQIETRKQQINEREAKYNALIANYQPTETIDYLRQEQDRRRLNELNQFISVNANRQAYVTYDFARELTALTDDLANDRITNDEALVRLTAYQNRIPRQTAVDALQQQEQLEANIALQRDYEERIAQTRTKLSDDNNYLLSIFALEKRDADTQSMEARSSKYALDMASNDNMLAKYEVDLKDIDKNIELKNERINQLHEDNIRLGVEFRRLGAVTTAAQLATFRKNIAANNKEIKALEKDLDGYDKEIITIEGLSKSLKEQNKQLKSRKDKLDKIIEKRKSDPEIDTAKKYSDQQELVRLEQGLAALKNREKYLDVDFETELAALVTDLQKDKENRDAIVPLAATLGAIKEQKEKEDSNDVIAPIVPPVTKEVPTEEKEDETVVAPLVPPVEQQEESNDVIAPIVPPTEEKEKNKIVAWLGKAKDNVVEAIRKNWKKYAAGLGAGVITVAMIASLKGCTDKRVLQNSDPIDVPEPEPTIEDTVAEPTHETEIEQQIEVPTVEESEVKQTVTPVSTPTKTKPTVSKSTQPTKTETTPTTPEKPFEPQFYFINPQEPEIEEIKTPIINPSAPIEEEPVIHNEPEYEDGEIIDTEIIPVHERYDEDDDDEKHDEPNTPSTPSTPSTPTLDEQQTITLQEGDTLIMPNQDGTSTIVDNSNWDNIDAIENQSKDEINPDYSSNDSITGVQIRDDGTMDVTITPSEATSNTTPTFDEPTQQELDDYYAILDELGISAPEEEQARTR